MAGAVSGKIPKYALISLCGGQRKAVFRFILHPHSHILSGETLVALAYARGGDEDRLGMRG